MKAILFMAVLVVSQAACMDTEKIIITVDPLQLSPGAVNALFESIRFQLETARVHYNRDMQRRFALEQPFRAEQQLKKMSGSQSQTSKL